MTAHGSILYLDSVSVSFDGFKALNNLSLILQPGEMRAIIGPNGAGKTTMMDVITSKTRPDTGDVIFDSSHDLIQRDLRTIVNRIASIWVFQHDSSRRIGSRLELGMFDPRRSDQVPILIGLKHHTESHI